MNYFVYGKLKRQTLESEIIDQDFAYKDNEVLNFKLFIHFAYEVRHSLVRMENILKNSIIFWEDLAQKPQDTYYLFKLAYRLSDKFIKVYERAVAISNIHFEKPFLNTFCNFLRTTGYRYMQFKLYFQELLRGKDSYANKNIRLNSSNVPIDNDFMMFVISSEKESLGKILFVSHSCKKLLDIEPSKLFHGYFDSLIVDGNIIRYAKFCKRYDKDLLC